MSMEVTVLVDNIGKGSIQGEWGLSFHISYNGRNYLLDTGGSDRFLTNAIGLGINLSDVDDAVLSHAHYDHSLGMEIFFGVNSKADFYVSPHAAEDCYARALFSSRYIGLPKGVLEAFRERIVRPEGVCRIGDGVWIVPHSAPVPAKVARASYLYVKRNGKFIPDDFAHEQSLVFETDAGLVIFNSCSHSGPEAIVSEVRTALPGKEVCAYFGGLHLFRLGRRAVMRIADSLRDSGVARIYTGHCTGDMAFEILKSRLGDSVVQLYSGLQVSI